MMPIYSEDQRQEPDHDRQANEEDDADGAAENLEHVMFLSKGLRKG
jgi:hypothetical protein